MSTAKTTREKYLAKYLAKAAESAPDTRGEIRRRSTFDVQRWRGGAWSIIDIFDNVEDARALIDREGRKGFRLIRVTETREVL